MATSDIGIDRPLPANLDAERFVLGGIMSDESAFLQAAGTLTPVNVAAGAILIAAASNNVIKGIYAYSMADKKTGRQALLFLIGLAVAGLVPLIWLR